MHGLDEYDSEARWYYPAIMRTTTIDPLAEKYYSISPYAWCGNNPIIAIDPTGEDVVIWYKDTNIKSGMSSYRYSGGEVKSTNLYVRKVVNALNYNINNGNKAKNGGGDPSKTAVNDHSLSINIYETDYQSQHDPGNNTVYWNPELGTETENGIIRSLASVMDHELDHAIYKIKYPKSYFNGLDNTKSKYGDREEERVITGSEQKTAIANGEIKNGQVTRTSHKGNYVVTNSETSTTVNKEKTNTKRKKIDEHNSTWTSEKSY